MFLLKTLACGAHYGVGILCLTEAGELQIDWVPEKDWATLESHSFAAFAKLPFHNLIDSGDHDDNQRLLWAAHGWMLPCAFVSKRVFVETYDMEMSLI